MASNPSAIGNVELMATGEKLNVWGFELNEVINRLIEMGVGWKTISLTTDKTLTTTNYDANESRWGMLEFTDGGLSGQPTVTFPAETRRWIVLNSGATYAVGCKANSSAEAAVTIEPSSWAFIYCDGTDMFVTDLATMSGALPLASLETIATSRLVGNMSGSTAVPTLVTVYDEDNMSSNSATGVPTQQSVKAYIDTIAAQGDLATVAAIASDVTAVAAIDTEVTTVSGISSDVTTVSGINGNVTTVAGISANVTTVAGIDTEVTTVAGDSADIQTVAGISSDVSTVAADSADIQTVAADGTDIGTVSTNIADVNTVAANIADVSAVAAIDSAVSAVAADATDIGTVATNIADVTTCADNIADIQDAADLIDGLTASDIDFTPAGTITSTNVQDALEELDTGGYTQISQTIVSGTPTSVEFTSITQEYSDLLFVIEGLSHDNGSSTTLQISISGDNGSSYSTGVAIGNGANTATLYGGVFITNYTSDAGLLLSPTSNMSADGSVAPASQYPFAWRLSGGIDAVKFDFSAGNVDAGTITLLGK